MIRDWAGFPWQRPELGALPAADRLHSSQAFCLSVWGTFAAERGGRVRSEVAALAGDQGFSAEIDAARGRFEITFEDVDRQRLNENSAPTNLDALLRFRGLAVAVESKLTESFGSCSQAGKTPKKCSGVFGPGSDLKTRTNAACRLDLPDGRRSARAYWDVMRRLSKDDAYPTGQPCAFAGPAYQVMRVIASAAQAGYPEWRAIFAYPAHGGASRMQIDSVVRRLRPEHQSKILHVDYLALSQRLRESGDLVARNLGLHMADRFVHCGLM